VAKVRIVLMQYLNSGWVAFDDVSLIQVGNSTNLAANPGFETHWTPSLKDRYFRLFPGNSVRLRYGYVVKCTDCEKDAAGNVCIGAVITHEAAGCYLHSEGPTIGVMGLGDVTVIATEDAVLVAPRERAEDVRTLASLAETAARADGLTRMTVHRPWGSFKTLRVGERYQVKQITVKPGGALSLQYHQRRAEHWVVVSGRARVWRGEEIFVLEENQSTYIPVGVKHRLENVGEGPLHLIEVQSGDYLGEDDIVRLEDLYGRT